MSMALMGLDLMVSLPCFTIVMDLVSHLQQRLFPQALYIQNLNKNV